MPQAETVDELAPGTVKKYLGLRLAHTSVMLNDLNNVLRSTRKQSNQYAQAHLDKVAPKGEAVEAAEEDSDVIHVGDITVNYPPEQPTTAQPPTSSIQPIVKKVIRKGIGWGPLIATALATGGIGGLAGYLLNKPTPPAVTAKDTDTTFDLELLPSEKK